MTLLAGVTKPRYHLHMTMSAYTAQRNGAQVHGTANTTPGIPPILNPKFQTFAKRERDSPGQKYDKYKI
jgi:hypothetical protein